MLASPVSRQTVLDNLGQSDPLIKDALQTLIERGDFIKSLPDDKKESSSGKSNKAISSPAFGAGI
jgi:pyruvate,water dikinase